MLPSNGGRAPPLLPRRSPNPSPSSPPPPSPASLRLHSPPCPSPTYRRLYNSSSRASYLDASHNPNPGETLAIDRRTSPAAHAALQAILYSHRGVVLSNLDLPSNFSDLAAIIVALLVHIRRYLALQVFHEIPKRRSDVNVSVLVSNVITILGKARMLFPAANFLNTLRHDPLVTLDAGAYNSLISSYTRNGQHQKAATVFRLMQEDDCRPNSLTYNILLSVYGKLRVPWGRITALLDSMKGDGFILDLYTYNTLISCCKMGPLHQEATDFFEEMKRIGIMPDIVTYNALLDVYCTSQMHAKAFMLLSDMNSRGINRDIVTYRLLTPLYDNDGNWETAIQLMDQMEAAGFMPDVSMFTVLISGFVNAGKDEFVMKAFKEMKSRACSPGTSIFNALINMYGNRGKFKEIMWVFGEIEVAGLVPNIHTWSTLLKIFGQNRMDSEVFGMFKEMEKVRVIPKRDAYNSLIRVYGHYRHFDQALLICERMLVAAITSNLSNYNTVLAALAGGGLWEQAERILKEMEDGQCEPSNSSFCYLLHAYANGNELDKLRILTEEIYAGSIEQDVYLETLIHVSIESNLLWETECAFVEIRKRDFPMDVATLHAMISMYGRRKMSLKANAILGFLIKSGVTPSMSTYNALIVNV